MILGNDEVLERVKPAKSQRKSLAIPAKDKVFVAGFDFCPGMENEMTDFTTNSTSFLTGLESK
jgi:hypothetical protein